MTLDIEALVDSQVRPNSLPNMHSFSRDHWTVTRDRNLDSFLVLVWFSILTYKQLVAKTIVEFRSGPLASRYAHDVLD